MFTLAPLLFTGIYAVQSTIPLTPLNRQDDSFQCCLVNSYVYATHSFIKIFAMMKTAKKASTFYMPLIPLMKSHNRGTATITVKVIVVVCGTQVLM